MKCTACAKNAKPSETFFCYWCGLSFCSDCIRHVLLPMDTEATVCLDCQNNPVNNHAADESMMELMVEGALAGHDLAEWVLVEDGRGWQTQCRLCQGTAWVGTSGVLYSLLSDRCMG